ncbi:hypothetical protein NQ315_014571 [Exocentrus adspersus]|uniref:MULE transposase domain-containing protein n=1 Tax=Exocentrus adspersus TaxID=1586481 RepID=A0AAV8VEP3_9CUCU|nr:hypothetical protein NQ315_014571 [Exocentrus adspersus]
MNMMEELGNEYENQLLDRHNIPTKTDVQTLWRKHFKDNYGPRTGEGMLLQLENCLKAALEANNTLYKINCHEGDYCVAICTPIMQRAEKLPQASEIMFVDASGNCDVQDHKVYFFLTQSAAGGIPLGCILSSSQKSDVFRLGVAALFEILPIKVAPSAIITDDDLGERNVLKLFWPKSTLLLCSFHVLKACWKWIQISKNGIPKEDSQRAYVIFRNILTCQTEEELSNAKKQFEQFSKYPKFTKYVESMLERIELWCLLYRRNLMIRGTNTNNYIEVTFRLLKDIALERTKAFNLTQLSDFIINNFEC